MEREFASREGKSKNSLCGQSSLSVDRPPLFNACVVAKSDRPKQPNFIFPFWSVSAYDNDVLAAFQNSQSRVATKRFAKVANDQIAMGVRAYMILLLRVKSEYDAGGF